MFRLGDHFDVNVEDHGGRDPLHQNHWTTKALIATVLGVGSNLGRMVCFCSVHSMINSTEYSVILFNFLLLLVENRLTIESEF